MEDKPIEPEIVTEDKSTNIVHVQVNVQQNKPDSKPNVQDKSDDCNEKYILHPDIRVTQARIKEVETNIALMLDGRPLSKLNILRIATGCMRITKNMSELPKNVKKIVLITALNRAIGTQCDKNFISEMEKEALLLMVSEVVSEVIDITYEISKQKCCVIV